ncbi:hypothetical protein [Micromonospora marina]|uniref:hypothetical protein n=1 Tax=Micromonospora marina TaxID=307120 RepID=UPI003453AAC8
MTTSGPLDGERAVPVTIIGESVGDILLLRTPAEGFAGAGAVAAAAPDEDAARTTVLLAPDLTARAELAEVLPGAISDWLGGARGGVRVVPIGRFAAGVTAREVEAGLARAWGEQVVLMSPREPASAPTGAVARAAEAVAPTAAAAAAGDPARTEALPGAATPAGWSFATDRPSLFTTPVAGVFVVEVAMSVAGPRVAGRLVGAARIADLIGAVRRRPGDPVVLVPRGAVPPAAGGALLCAGLARAVGSPVIGALGPVQVTATGVILCREGLEWWSADGTREEIGDVLPTGRSHPLVAGSPTGDRVPPADSGPVDRRPRTTSPTPIRAASLDLLGGATPRATPEAVATVPAEFSRRPPTPAAVRLPLPDATPRTAVGPDPVEAGPTAPPPGRPPSPPAGGADAATPAAPVVPAGLRLAGPSTPPTVEDRAELRRGLNGRYDSFARTVSRMLAEQPGLRSPGGDNGVVTGLVAVRAYVAEARSRTNAYLRGPQEQPVPGDGSDLLARCAVHGLQRLPVALGPVFVAGDAGAVDLATAYRPGQEIVEPAFLDARLTPGGGDVEYAIWSASARRLGLLGAADGGSALFPPGSRFSVLAVDSAREHGRDRILLQDLASVGAVRPGAAAPAERVIARLRAAVAVAPAGPQAVAVAFAPGLDPGGVPFPVPRRSVPFPAATARRAPVVVE